MPWKSLVSHPVHNLFALYVRESRRASQSRQVQASSVQSTLSPTNEGMPPLPQHTVVEQPIKEPPRSWSAAPMTNRKSDIDSAEKITTANKNLPAKTRENTVEEEMRDSRKRIMASQSSTTGHLPPQTRRAPHLSTLSGNPREG